MLLRRELLRWYRKNGRTFPWRETRIPYRVWVSEIMLQQTQVDRVIPYYERFLTELPTVRELARASERTLLKLWRGLGYYRRARNLRDAAREIVQQRSFPRTEAELLMLPGIGKYTARAILAFAFDENYIPVDTNIARVLERLQLGDGQVLQVRNRRPRDLALALMDLGSLVCKPKPLCEECPVQRYCPSKGSFRETKRAVAPKREKLIDVGVGCVHRDGLYLIARRHRDGKWEFPGGKRESGEDIRGCLKRELQEELGIEVSVRPPFHAEDVKPFRLHFCRCQILQGTPKAYEHREIRWVRKEELEQFDFASSNRSILARLKKMRS